MRVLKAIRDEISKAYPDAINWYVTKVANDKNKRVIRFRYGFIILDYAQKKICSLFVYEEFRGFGYGAKLFERSFEELGTRKPLLTVNKINIDGIKSMLDKYGFELTYIENGEYIFNAF